MSPSRSAAVLRTNLLLQVRDPMVHLLMVAVPLVIIPFLIPAAKAQLQVEGYLHATGAEQVVPGFAVLFSFLSVQQIIMMFFHEYAWGTWDRLRASPATAADILAGKAGVAYAVQLLQLTAVLALGSLLYGYRPAGSLPALALVVALFAAALCCFGLMIVALCASMDLALAVSNLVGMLMAGLGGALGPVESFPDWARTISRISPAYWAMDAVRRISLQGAGIGAVGLQLAVLAGFGAAFLAVALVRFRVDDSKTGDG